MPVPKRPATVSKQDIAEGITRQDKRAWWCPCCDHSNTHLTARCGGCGTQRDGDTVTP